MHVTVMISLKDFKLESARSTGIVDYNDYMAERIRKSEDIV